MSRDKTLRRYISGLLILMASLTAMPASQAVAQIFQGEAEPKIFYSDSGAAVENPVTNTDLDNFSISLHYGTMEEEVVFPDLRVYLLQEIVQFHTVALVREHIPLMEQSAKPHLQFFNIHTVYSFPRAVSATHRG